MNSKAAKKLRRLVKHINEKSAYNADEKQPTLISSGLWAKGVPRTLQETCARSVYKRLKANYDAG